MNATRLLRLWWSFFKNSLSRELEFRWHFLAMFSMDIVWYLVQYLMFDVLYLYAPQLGGWHRNDIMVFLGTMFVIDALNMLLTSSNFWAFPELVRSGELDFYLSKPVSTAFLAMFRFPSIGSMFNLIVALGFLIYSLSAVPLADRILGIVLYPLFIVLGLVAMIAFQYLFMALAIRMVAAEGIQWILHSLHSLGQRPDSIYRGFMRRALLTIFPMAMIASVPARLLQADPDFLELLISGVCTVVYLFLSIYIFERTLVKYSGASA